MSLVAVRPTAKIYHKRKGIREASITVDCAIGKDPRTRMEASIENRVSGSRSGTWLTERGSEVVIDAEKGRKKEKHRFSRATGHVA
jgi:hypothetical protein